MSAQGRILAAIGLGLLLATSCHKPQPAPPPPPPPPPPPATQNLVVLLPNEDGTVGKVTVTNAGVTRELADAYAGVRVDRADTPPGPPLKVDQAEVNRIFGSTLAVTPAPEVSFTLYFLSDTATMDQPSRDLLPEIFKAIQERHSTDIEVIGHTDTTGTSEANQALGLKRAQEVAETLRSMGMISGNMSVASHGDSDLLVQTPKGVPEPKNRRVEVIVR